MPRHAFGDLRCCSTSESMDFGHGDWPDLQDVQEMVQDKPTSRLVTDWDVSTCLD